MQIQRRYDLFSQFVVTFDLLPAPDLGTKSFSAPPTLFALHTEPWIQMPKMQNCEISVFHFSQSAWRQCWRYLINPPLPTDHISVTPKQVLEYPKLPLSRLSDVIKWQAPLNADKPTDRQMCPVSICFPQTGPGTSWGLRCAAVWFGLCVLFKQRAPVEETAWLVNNETLKKKKFHWLWLNLQLNRETNIKWNWQFPCCLSSKARWGLVVKTVEPSGFGPDRPQRG